MVFSSSYLGGGGDAQGGLLRMCFGGIMMVTLTASALRNEYTRPL